ncbi:hypothetical protein BDY19DRAFT_994958 [Irpex rosettiformis]|uniref:Uncharacterized protein n=1 Tax=Irpex rosettiformis TaxID=378272 RepID=A0ACB8U087_9APHY|nr:hypothetical protein BDY19DRAFT_994958 [Irpex rosettiformis]
MSSIYPLEPPIFTNPFSQQPARLDPFPSFPVDKPPMRSLEVPVYQDNHLPLPPFNQTPDELSEKSNLHPEAPPSRHPPIHSLMASAGPHEAHHQIEMPQ